MDRLLSMRVFRRVVDEGGFAAAARALELSPAVVTRLVADLESHLGTRLLQRTTRRLTVTDAGAAYLERLRGILADIDDADASVSGQTQELAGLLHIATPPVLATYVVGPLVASFRQLHPAIRFDVTAYAGEAPSIEDNDITLLTTGEPFDAGIIARRIVSTDVVLVAAPQYLYRRGVPEQPQDLATHDCLRLRLPGLRPNVWRLTRADPAGAPGAAQVEDVPVTPVVWTNHTETLMRAALDGAGITSTTLEIAAEALTQGDLVWVLRGWTVGRPSIYAALPSRKHMPRRVRAFLDHLTTQTQAALAGVQTLGL